MTAGRVDRPPTIIAMGGGGFSQPPDDPRLDEYVLAATGVDRPRVCFLPTATSNADRYLATFYPAFASRTEAMHLDLFVRDGRDLQTTLLAQDVIYVGGGNTANMLAIWRVHGVDRDPARGVAARRRPGRSLGRLVCAGSSRVDGLVRPGLRRCSMGSDSCPGSIPRTTTARPRGARASTSWSARGRSGRRYAARRRRRGPLPRDGACRGRRRARRRARRIASSSGRGATSRRELPTRYLG